METMEDGDNYRGKILFLMKKGIVELKSLILIRKINWGVWKKSSGTGKWFRANW
jgi:hypothetical protein